VRRLVALAGALLVAGCGGTASTGSAATAPGPTTSAPRRTVTVFAASSLTESFRALAAAFEKGSPGTTVRLSFAGSPSLVAQVQQGARPDLVVTADATSISALAPDLDGAPVVLARNALAVVTEKGNPKHLSALGDLGRPGLKVVLGAPDVPVGRAAQAALGAARVRVAPVSQENDVKAVLSKVRLGEADAGVVYATDLASAGADVGGFALPGAVNSYPAGVVRGAPDAGGGRALLAFATGPDGQAVLHRYGFLPP
jgi:molybdate transport system substrate-binding protein